jgi:pseudouridine-5'-phosphate glycosidase
MNATLHNIVAEVSHALQAQGPVVALESTLIAQGLPRPENLETARAAEAAVRAAGAVPATIAVVEGQIRVGLEPHELERLAKSGAFSKASRRDLAAAVAHRRNAATTVSATIWIAHQCGIRVMATGGLGGVHRDAAASFDISNDLDALALANGVAIVCSGFKSILDLPACLEALESRGVAIAGYRTSTLPAFTTVSSGLPLETRVDDCAEAVALINAHRGLGLPGAIVIAQPPPPKDAIDHAQFEAALGAALSDARAQRVDGKALTPFVLERVRVATAGASLRANRALVVANAGLAGAIASGLAAAK